MASEDPFSLSLFAVMALIQRLITFIVYSDLWVAFAAASLSWQAAHYFPREEFTGGRVWMIFLCVFIAYKYLRWRDARLPAETRVFPASAPGRKVQLGLAVAAAGLVVFLLWSGDIPLAGLLPPALLVLLYPAAASRGKKRWKGLRRIPALKMLAVGLCWAWMAVVFPLFPTGIDRPEVWLLFISRSLFIMALIIPFDIRDLSRDEADIQTLPQRIGPKKARLTGILMLLGALIPEVLLAFMGSPGYLLTAHLLTTVFAIYMLRNSEVDGHPLYCSGGVEALPVVLYLLSLFAGFAFQL